MISYCDICGEYLGDYVNGVLFKFGKRVTEPHLCPGMDYHREESPPLTTPLLPLPPKITDKIR